MQGDLNPKSDFSGKEGRRSRAEDTRQRILMAAGEAFRAQGYARSTTRGIAAAAGVTEVTLFRHFASKENLFQAVVDHFGNVQGMVAGLEARFSGDVRADLMMIGEVLAKVMIERADSILMMVCESSHFPEIKAVGAGNPRRLRAMLARYLEGQIARGQVRQCDPELAAQAFLGMFFSYAITEAAFDEKPSPETGIEDVLTQFVDIFLAGMLAKDS
jgi:TetR/AcrR family transcriptional regulator, mexJK operon transcriptional repressor